MSSCPAVDLQRFNVPGITVAYEEIDHEDAKALRCRVTLRVKDVNTGNLSTVQRDEISKIWPRDNNHEWFKENTRNCVMLALLHEVHECLFLDGSRCFEPHELSDLKEADPR